MKLTVIEKILIFATALMLISVFSNKHSSPPDNKPPQVKQVESPKVVDLGLTVSEFRLAYEELVEENALPALRISETYTSSEKGEYKTFFYTSDTVAVELETDSTKNDVQSITVFCEPNKGSRKASQRAVIAFIFVVRILNPDFTDKECGRIYDKLSANLKNYSVVEGDLRYKTRMYNGILMLSAEPK